MGTMAFNYDHLSPRKQLTAEELEKQVERLTAPRHEVELRDPFDVCPTKRIPAEAITKMTDRLYTQSVQHRQERLAAAEEAAYGAHTRGNALCAASLAPEDREQSVKRLYRDSVERRQANMEQLRRQYQYQRPANKTVPLNTFVQHMYYDRLEAKKKTEKRLYETYLAPTEIHTGIISREEADEASNRLCTTKTGS
ncbi:hypothetical protein CUR178_00130 [Leishmania enriettii]|uniref:Uncharacterized protein n=1 Tax=Leishmania enriettii TaxID=5663 RepID=A0A836KAV1_LEIEN|nr:hypothetical protein CUR178_00130 [Leishmania enriettii]